MSAKTIWRWVEIDDWFRKEFYEVFEFALNHYGQELDLIPPNRRHRLFAEFRVPYEGKQIYDHGGKVVSHDEYIDDDGFRRARIMPLTPEEEQQYLIAIQQAQDKVQLEPTYCEGDISAEAARLSSELKQRQAVTPG